MKKILSIILASLMIAPLCNAEVWPDGTKMEKWFTSKPEKTKGKEAAEEYGLGYNLVAGANIAGFKKVATAMMEQGCF